MDEDKLTELICGFLITLLPHLRSSVFICGCMYLSVVAFVKFRFPG